MEHRGWAGAGREGVDHIDPQTTGTTLWVGAPGEALIDLARALQGVGRRFVIVARSLPSAVRLAEELSPEETDLFARAAQAEQGPPSVTLYRGHARPSQRRALQGDHQSGATLGLIVTPEDLDSYHVVDELSAAEDVVWIVEDAHRLSVFAPGHSPALRAVARVPSPGARVLLTDLDDAGLLADLGRLLGFGPDAVARGGGAVPSSVAIEVDREPSLMGSRAALSACLRRHLPEGARGRAVVVAPLRGDRQEGLPASELVSVGEELGLRPLRDPGEDADAQTSAWRSILRQDDILLLSDDADALGILPGGEAPTFVRLIPPEAPEVVLQEVRALARSGGGKWVFAGAPSSPQAPALSVEAVGQAVTRLVEGLEGDGPAAFDLLGSTQGLALGDGAPADRADALAAALKDLAGLGLFADVRDVKLSLEVAEASRLRPPFISGDARYEALVEAYDTALKALPLAESVRFRLEAREPHDMRVLAGRLGYSVAALGGLFDDLGRDGIVVCQRRLLGPRGTRNVEITPGAPWGDVLARLPEALGALEGLRARRGGWAQAVATVVEAEDPRGALEAALGAELAHVSLPVASVAVFVASSAPAVSREAAPEAAPSLGNTLPRPPQPPPEAATAAPEVAAPVGDDLASRVAALDVGASARALAEVAAAVASARDKARHLAVLEGGNPGQRAAGALVRTADWDAQTAVEALTALVEEGHPLPVGELIARVEFHPLKADGSVLVDAPESVVALALRLPLAESLAGAAAAEAIRRAAGELQVEAAELGSVKVRLGGETFLLERRGAAPEVEALLWLAAHARGGDDPPEALRVARLAEALVAVAGMGDAALSQRLAEVVAAWGGPVPDLDAGRWTFAVARALMAGGRFDEALSQLLEVDLPQALEGERLKAVAAAAVAAGRPEAALSWAASEGRAAGAFQAMVSALEDRLREDGRAGEISALASGFRPDDGAFWSFLVANPFGADADAQRGRIEARSEGGLPPAPMASLLSLLDGPALGWPVDLLGEIFAAVTRAEAADWLELADRLLKADRPTSARLALEQAGSLGEDRGARLMAARICLAEGDVAGALTHGALAEIEALGRAIRRALGEGWADALTALVGEGGLDDGQRAIAEGLIADGQEKEKLSGLRSEIQAALGAGKWREAILATRALEEALGPDARDRVVAGARARLQERADSLWDRLEELRRRGPRRRRPQDVDRLIEAAEGMGMPDVVAGARELMAEAAPPPAPERSAPRPQEDRPARGEGRRSDGPRPDARRGDSPRGEPPQGDTRRGPPPSERSEPGGAGSISSVADGPAEGLPDRLKAASAAANHDRVRSTLVIGVLKKTLASQPEAALRGLKECLPTFQRVEVLDAPLARLVRGGEPTDEHLPRLRRALANVEARFRATFEALSSRENPEPWKQILGQLKIGR